MFHLAVSRMMTWPNGPNLANHRPSEENFPDIPPGFNPALLAITCRDSTSITDKSPRRSSDTTEDSSGETAITQPSILGRLSNWLMPERTSKTVTTQMSEASRGYCAV